MKVQTAVVFRKVNYNTAVVCTVIVVSPPVAYILSYQTYLYEYSTEYTIPWFVCFRGTRTDEKTAGPSAGWTLRVFCDRRAAVVSFDIHNNSVNTTEYNIYM